MSGKRTTHDLIKQAERDLAQGRAELLRELKRLPVADWHTADPLLFSRLTAQQRADLFAHATHRSHRVAPDPHIRPSKRRIGPFSLWNRLPRFARSQLLGLMTAAVLTSLSGIGFQHQPLFAAIVSTPESLPTDASGWPSCKRLSSHQDGCTYTVQQSLTWNDAAQVLGQDLTDLRTNNSHLKHHQRLVQGDDLIVWRNRIRLED